MGCFKWEGRVFGRFHDGGHPDDAGEAKFVIMPRLGIQPPLEDFMPLALTSQEKKVLGFVALMTILGLVALAVRKCAPGSGHPPDSPRVKAPAETPPERK